MPTKEPATHCSRGHLWDDETTFWRVRTAKNGGTRRHRECVICRKMNQPRLAKRERVRLDSMDVIVTTVTAGVACLRDDCTGSMREHWYSGDVECSQCSRGATAVMGEVKA